MRRVWLTVALVAVLLADLALFVGWMGATLDENCGDPGQPKCNEFLRDAWPEAFVVMLIVALGVALGYARQRRST